MKLNIQPLRHCASANFARVQGLVLYPLNEFVLNWFRHYGVGLNAAEWLALAMVILVAIVPSIALLKPAIRLLTTKRNKSEKERNYWRIHIG